MKSYISSVANRKVTFKNRYCFCFLNFGIHFELQIKNPKKGTKYTKFDQKKNDRRKQIHF